MSQGFDKRFGALQADGGKLLHGGLKGVEKESLRVGADGYLSQTKHPAGLGSPLSNRFVTTDFSEALLEFVTPAFASTWEALRFLCDIHQFTYERLEAEMLWVASMPCRIPDTGNIPLARYGTSNVGQMKTAYRRGLGLRYGRDMQTIAGVHFNYSLPPEFWPGYRALVGTSGEDDAFRSEQYLGLVRNFRRVGWLVLYLFGASPAMCKSFGRASALNMPQLDSDTWFEPFGTSLRMSDLGYSNQTQSSIDISLNSLDAYIEDLRRAIRTPEPQYESFGVKVDGEYRQLSANQLQIENEYYSPIRPKRVARSGEWPTAALQRGGVEYVEIRSLDLNIGDPSGINQNTMRFIEALLIYCLVEDSPEIDAAAMAEIRWNQTGTAKRGRDPSFRLVRNGAELTLAAWANEILDKVAGIAGLIDRAEGADSYSQSVELMRGLVAEPETTPSARLIHELREAGCSFFEYVLSVAHKHKDYFAATEPLSEARHREFEEEVLQSIERQREVERSDTISFDDYLANYFHAK